MTSPNTPVVDLEARVAEIVAATGQSEESVRAILGALNHGGGEALHTVRYDPATGAIAHRVMDRDVVKWRISHPADGVMYEMAPTKSNWPLLATLTPATAPPTEPEPEQPEDPGAEETP